MNDKKQGLLELGITAVKALLGIMLVINTFVFIFYGIINRGDVIPNDPVRFIDDWSVNPKDNGDQELRSILPQNIMDTKAIVLTANAVAGSRQMYLDAGFEDYLTKPLDSNLLERTLKNMLPADIVKESESIDFSDEIMEFEPIDSAETESSYNEPISLEGMDYEVALLHCGGEEDFLFEIMGDIAAECSERSDRMKVSLKNEDVHSYEIDSHTIKSSMANIGMMEFSERAKKHEYAEAFIAEYINICNKLENYLSEINN